MAIKLDGHAVTALKLKASNGTEVIKQLTEEGTIPTPSGTLDISANGLVDVEHYKNARVQVPTSGDHNPIISVAANGLITASCGGESTTHQISSADDADFDAGNIKEGVTLFGLLGTLASGGVRAISGENYLANSNTNKKIPIGQSVSKYIALWQLTDDSMELAKNNAGRLIAGVSLHNVVDATKIGVDFSVGTADMCAGYSLLSSSPVTIRGLLTTEVGIFGQDDENFVVHTTTGAYSGADYVYKWTVFDLSEASTRTLESISATFTQGATKIHPSTELNSLKSMLAVTAYYDDDTTATLDAADYTLSGTLTEGTSVITVTCREKTTTFDATVTAEEPVSGLVYALAQPMVCDGTQELVDTGLTPYDADRDITFLTKFSYDSADLGKTVFAAHSSGFADNGGYYVETGATNFGQNNIASVGALRKLGVLNPPLFVSGNNDVAIAITVHAGDNYATVKITNNNGAIATHTLTSTEERKYGDQHLLVGGGSDYQAANKFIGTLSDLKVYYTVLDDATIEAYLRGE